MAHRDDHVYDAREIIGWLNYLFGEHYTNRRATNLWRIYQLLPDYRKDDNLLPLLPDNASMDVLGTLIYLAVTREDHEEEWKQFIAVPPHGPEEITLPDCIRIAENALKDLKASDEVSETQKLEQLKSVLKAGGQKISPEIPKLYRFIGGITSLLPVEITAKLVADTFSLDFPTLLEELQPYARDVRELWNYKDRQSPKPIPPVDTASFLGCSDDDRAWWWTPGGDVHFSGEMNVRLSQCRTELETLASQRPLLPGTETLKLLIETLYDVQEQHRYVFSFREMFYDFVAHSELPLVQAAIRYLRQLLEREPDSPVNLRRYLAIMGNLPLREKVFGF